MPRFCANLFMLFNELPLLDRFKAAADAGFDAVEVLFPYGHPAEDVANVLNTCGLPLILINTPAPGWATGDRGLAAIPGRKQQFKADFKRALHYARLLKSNIIHIMSGCAEGPIARQTFIDNLKWATEFAPDQQLTLEPINPVDVSGYFLNDFNMSADIIDTVGAPNLGLQFDTYHAHKITGNMLKTWREFREHTVHVQVADPVGRHEPDRQTIDYPAFFAQLDSEEYAGYVSGEYIPKGQTVDGLGWIR